MGWERRRDPAGFVVTEIRGRMDAATSRESLRDLADWVDDGTLTELVLHHGDTRPDVSFPQALKLAGEAVAFFRALRGGRVAFVASHDGSLGQLRRLGSLVGDAASVRLSVFRDESVARAWLTDGGG